MPRIEIKACGFGSNVQDFQSSFNSYIDNCDDVISSFKAVKNETYNLNSGVGSLGGALDEIEARIREEENQKSNAQNVSNKVNSFVELTCNIDNSVAKAVDKNKKELYDNYGWNEPESQTNEEKGFWDKAADWVCDRTGWNRDTFDKVMKTAGIVIGAAAAVGTVIGTAGLSLAPILSIVVPAGASAISVSLSAAAVATTVGAAALNVADTWNNIDDPTFNNIQNALNVSSGVLNAAYSIGTFYNSLKGYGGKEFLAREKAKEYGNKGYGELAKKHPQMKDRSGANYTQSKKKAILEENMRRNNGVLRSDKTGKKLIQPKKLTPGSKPSPYEAQIDHINPKSNGGFNSFDNAQVIEREANIHKSNKLVFDDYMLYSKPDKANPLGIAGSTGLFITSNVNAGYGVSGFCVPKKQPEH